MIVEVNGNHIGHEGVINMGQEGVQKRSGGWSYIPPPMMVTEGRKRLRLRLSGLAEEGLQLDGVVAECPIMTPPHAGAVTVSALEKVGGVLILW